MTCSYNSLEISTRTNYFRDTFLDFARIAYLKSKDFRNLMIVCNNDLYDVISV